MTTRDNLLIELAAAVDEIVDAVQATTREGWCCDVHTPCNLDVATAANNLEERLREQS